MAIRHRKNSLFYKTLNGAKVGDAFMSLVSLRQPCVGGGKCRRGTAGGVHGRVTATRGKPKDGQSPAPGGAGDLRWMGSLLGEMGRRGRGPGHGGGTESSGGRASVSL